MSAISEKMKRTDDDILDDLIEHFANTKRKVIVNMNRGQISREEFLFEVDEFFRLRRIPAAKAAEVKSAYEKFLFGYYILDELINDLTISDIRAMNENNIRIKRRGKRLSTDIKFKSKEDFKRFVEQVAIKNEVNLSDINAQQVFTDAETNENFILRFNISTGYINTTKLPYLTIRKIPKKKYLLDDLIDLKVLNKKTADYLKDAIINKPGIIICGKGSSGKTTMMNALLEEIPHDESGLVIQESEELFSNHPEMMFQKEVKAKGESKISYSLKELSINGLVADLDWFIIGEIKGGEALYFLNASYTGHKVMCSIHSFNSMTSLDKMADYIKYGSDYSRTDALRMLSTLSLVVFMKDFKVKEISEIKGWDENSQSIKYEKIELEEEL